MRDVFTNFVALLTRNTVAKRCVFADLYTCFIYNTLYNRLKLAGSSHILTKCMDAQRRTALFLSLKAWAVRRVCVTGVYPANARRCRSVGLTSNVNAKLNQQSDDVSC